MAKATPTTVIHQGDKGGIANASKTAVTGALPSLRKGRNGRWRNISIKASAMSATTTASTTFISTAGPKYQVMAMTAGISAISTCSICRVTRLVPARNGGFSRKTGIRLFPRQWSRSVRLELLLYLVWPAPLLMQPVQLYVGADVLLFPVAREPAVPAGFHDVPWQDLPCGVHVPDS